MLGLIPGLGDAIGLVMGFWIVGEAVHRGAGRATLGRMMANLALDALVGTLPILGDAYDVTRKANLRNIALLDRHLADRRATAKASGRYLALLGVTAVVTTLAVLVGGFLLARWALLLILGH